MHVIVNARLLKHRYFSSGNEPDKEEFLAPPPNMASTPLRDVEKEEDKGK